jgi:8-oxo-dGTP diphosphatase
LYGAAGLFLARRGHDGRVAQVVLQHRALFSHQGGTWGIPGGAIMPGETAVEGALREASEEAGITPRSVRVLGSQVLDHGPWSYTTVLAEQVPGTTLNVHPSDHESIEIAWVDVADLTDRPLLTAFGATLPGLLDQFATLA